MTSKLDSMIGKQFGSLTAIRPLHKNSSNIRYWEYLCICGKTHIARGNTVTFAAKKGDPEVPSCGCVELARKTKHGFRKVRDTHPAYRVYRGMMSRCYDSNDSGYKWYGAIGVTVCEEWRGHPEVFVEWAIANGWKPGLHIDKDILSEALNIHPHVYSPQTCQWVSAKTNVGFSTNRDNFGKHPNVRLSHAQVEEILRLYFSENGPKGPKLAEMFNVGTSAIYRLIKLFKERAA